MVWEETDALFQDTEHFPLNPDSPVPLYHQMEQIILDRIASRDCVGAMLPAEGDLMRMFGVSRATVKKALGIMVSRGLLERRRALGTRVVRGEITEDLTRLSSYTEKMEGKGLSVRTRVLEVKTHVPEEAVRHRLRLEDGERTLIIRRLRGTNEVFPVVVLQSEIPERFGIDPGEDFEGSLYRLIEDRYHIPIEWADEEIFARGATREEARCLEIEAGDGVLVMERLTATRGNRFLEYVRGVYRPECYRFSLRLKR